MKNYWLRELTEIDQLDGFFKELRARIEEGLIEGDYTDLQLKYPKVKLGIRLAINEITKYNHQIIMDKLRRGYPGKFGCWIKPEGVN